MPETITTRCPSWARSKHRSLMTRVSGGFRSSGKKSPFTEVAILGYPTVQFKKADSFGFEPRRAAIGEKRPKNRGRMRALCKEMWTPRRISIHERSDTRAIIGGRQVSPAAVNKGRTEHEIVPTG